MLELRHLTRTYGDITALDDLSFEVPKGAVFGFLGANGAGKTTTMRAIFGLTALDDGEVSWNGVEIDEATRRTFGYMPEERGLYADMRIADQLVYFGRIHGMTRRSARDATGRWLKRLGLSDRADANLEDLSMGNQQRIQLAAALVHNPELLVLDEPFSGLDPVGVDLMSHVIAECADGGATVLFSSHQLDLVEDICEAVAIINHGRLVKSGAVSELASAGPELLTVAVDGDPEGAWTIALGDTIVVESVEDGIVTLALGPEGDDQAVLAAASAAGRVKLFAHKRRRLSEVFRESMGA
jgi:ABC-2 type transport system ATP-binding protein